eukprot:scaffold1452_cov202-Prasinococcus_capsulatus_cf.AAC.1
MGCRRRAAIQRAAAAGAVCGRVWPPRRRTLGALSGPAGAMGLGAAGTAAHDRFGCQQRGDRRTRPHRVTRMYGRGPRGASPRAMRDAAVRQVEFAWCRATPGVPRAAPRSVGRPVSSRRALTGLDATRPRA